MLWSLGKINSNNRSHKRKKKNLFGSHANAIFPALLSDFADRLGRDKVDPIHISQPLAGLRIRGHKKVDQDKLKLLVFR